MTFCVLPVLSAADSGENSDMNEIAEENEANQLQLNEVQEMQRQQEVVSEEHRVETDVCSAQNGASAARSLLMKWCSTSDVFHMTAD